MSSRAVKIRLTKEVNEQKEYFKDIESLSKQSSDKQGFYYLGKFISHFHVSNEKIKLESLIKKRKALDNV